MKNFLLTALSVLLLSVSLSSCYVEGPGYGYAAYHPAPRFYGVRGGYYRNPGWGGHRSGWEKSGHNSGDAKTRRGYRR